MERGGAMFLDDENERVLLFGLRAFAGRLGRNVEVPLFRVFLQCHVFILTRAHATAFARTLQHEWSVVPSLSGVCCRCCVANRRICNAAAERIAEKARDFMPAPQSRREVMPQFLRRSSGFCGVLLHGIEKFVEGV